MKVVEIFKSIEGEGIRTGMPATFVRLFGCNLHCSYCDTRYACDDDSSYTEMKAEEIVEKCGRNGLMNITVTGGEPLLHDGIIGLLSELLEKGYNVNVETNGTLPFASSRRMIRKQSVVMGSLLFTVDYKCSSSGENDSMCFENFLGMHQNDVLKFVVGTKEDMEQALRFYYKLVLNGTVPIVYISPVYGKIDAKELVKFVVDNKLDTWRVQVQLHKVIWKPEERGV